jgi:4-hydroxybenzoate polyprenyltransferase
MQSVENNQNKNPKNILVFLFLLIKSRTIVYGFAIASLGTYFIANGFQIPDPLVILKITASTYLLALATYLYNDLTDLKIDSENQTETSYSTKKVEHGRILFSTISFFIISISLAFSINLLVGISSLVFTGLAIAYSHPMTHLKDMFVIKTVVTALGGFIASMMGAFAAENFSSLVLASSFIVFLFYFVNGPLNDIRDVKGDQIGGRRTIPIVLGVKKSFYLINAIVLSVISILIISFLMFNVHFLGLILGLIISAYLLIRIKKLSYNYVNRALMNKTRTLVRNSMFAVQISLWFGFIITNFEFF